MKTHILISLVFTGAFIAPFTYAEEPANATTQKEERRANVEERVTQLKEKLSLTDDQAAKIKGIFQSDEGKLKELRADTALSQEDRRAKIQEVRNRQRELVAAVLTPEQQTKWKEEADKRRSASAED